MDLNNEKLDIYTTLEDAKVEIQKRWNDKDLRKKVAAYLSNAIPKPFESEPRAVLARNIASPDIEFLHFLKKSKAIRLSPVVLEYLEDKFFTMSPDKMGLCKMNLFYGKDKSGKNIIKKKNIIDFKHNDKKKFNEIETIWGESLIDFHHSLIDTEKNNFNLRDNVFDVSTWYRHMGNNASDYYHFYLSLFICHGVLFENYIDDGCESKFTKNVFMPAFEKVEMELGLRPIIVALIPESELNDKKWWSYSLYVKSILYKKLT